VHSTSDIRADGFGDRRLEGYFEELAPILAQPGTPPEYYQLAADYGIVIQNGWIEDLERTYGVKL
jgi:hypothetical protein